MKIAAYVIQRLKEPSTYAGIAALLAAFGVTLSDEIIGGISMVGAGVAGILAAVLPENK